MYAVIFRAEVNRLDEAYVEMAARMKLLFHIGRVRSRYGDGRRMLNIWLRKSLGNQDGTGHITFRL